MYLFKIKKFHYYYYLRKLKVYYYKTNFFDVTPSQKSLNLIIIKWIWVSNEMEWVFFIPFSFFFLFHFFQLTFYSYFSLFLNFYFIYFISILSLPSPFLNSHDIIINIIIIVMIIPIIIINFKIKISHKMSIRFIFIVYVCSAPIDIQKIVYTST